MKVFRNRSLGLSALGLFSGFSMAALPGCDGDSPLGDIAEQCGLVCPDTGILEGNASISGNVSIDAFFGAVVNVNTAAVSIEASLRSEFEAIAASLGVTGTAEMDLGQLAGAVEAGIKAKLSANVSGGLTIKAKPPRCEASAEVALDAAAKCDVEATPGMADIKCEGSCQIDASASAECEASGELKCEGTAPGLACEGTCSGTCQLEAEASCEGTCNGTCSGTCSVENADGSCAGECDGMCQGSCELTAGGSCSGKCEGSCEYTPPEGGCEANAAVKCNAMADANVECKGGCDGEITPPSVKAECEASVNAEVKAKVECKPAELDIAFEFAAGVDADAQLEFRAWLKTFKARYAAILAIAGPDGKAGIVLDAIVNAETGLIASASGAVKGAVDASLEGDLDLKASVGLGCALTELESVGAALADAQASLQGSASAFASVSGSLGG